MVNMSTVQNFYLLEILEITIAYCTHFLLLAIVTGSVLTQLDLLYLSSGQTVGIGIGCYCSEYVLDSVEKRLFKLG